MPARTPVSYVSRITSIRLTPTALDLIATMAAADGLNRQHWLETIIRQEAARRGLPVPLQAPATVPPPAALPMLDGAQVRALRLARGWSMGELGRQAGTKTSTVSRIEAGGHGTRPITAQALARALGVPLRALQVPAESPPAGTP